jgi:hypothetical protein
MQRLVKSGAAFTVWRDRHGAYCIDCESFEAWLALLPQVKPFSPVSVVPGSVPQVVAVELVHALKAELEAAHAREAELLAVIKALAGQLRVPQLPQRALEATLPVRERVLRYLQQAPQAKNVHQVQEALGLTTSPDRTIRTLVADALVIAVRPGLYTAAPPACASESPRPASPITLLEKVWRVVHEAERPLKGQEVQAQLGVKRPVTQELSRLVRDRKILRVGQSTYAGLGMLGIE